MIWKGNGICKMEEGEPAMRSCWECNGAHERIKDTNFLHICFNCGKFWILGRYFDFNSDEECDDFFKSKGLEPGNSTQKITNNQ